MHDSLGDVGSLHFRASSQTGFGDLESFDEIRHDFEFVENRLAFYPLDRHDSLRRDSILSIASVSSYGIVINSGVKGPFYQNQPACCLRR